MQTLALAGRHDVLERHLLHGQDAVRVRHQEGAGSRLLALRGRDAAQHRAVIVRAAAHLARRARALGAPALEAAAVHVW